MVWATVGCSTTNFQRWSFAVWRTRRRGRRHSRYHCLEDGSLPPAGALRICVKSGSNTNDDWYHSEWSLDRSKGHGKMGSFRSEILATLDGESTWNERYAQGQWKLNLPATGPQQNERRPRIDRGRRPHNHHGNNGCHMGLVVWYPWMNMTGWSRRLSRIGWEVYRSTVGEQVLWTTAI